jgi:hypothetical protein
MGIDVRAMYDKTFLYSYDLQGRDITVVISKVVAGKVVGEGGKESKKPVIYFRGKEKGLALCITNARTIAAMYGGFDADKWIGKAITLFPTTTQFGPRTVDCIRIRPTKPGKGAPVDETPDAVQPEREAGADDDEGAAA